jgi:outer membrane protein OmpA-like peptidoglycan-associated protein
MLVRSLFVFVVVLFGLTPVWAQDVPGSQDHPILTRYPESVIRWYDVQNHATYKIATGPITGYRQIANWVETQGQVTRIYYDLVGTRTHSEVYANYKQALADAGFEIIAEGLHADVKPSNEIGSRTWLPVFYDANPFPSSANIELLAGSATAGGSSFLAGKKERAAGTVYVAITVTQQRADRVTYLIDVIEVAALETDLIVVDAEAIGKGIDEFGRIALYGLFFDHDKATLKPESKPALDEIAEFLNARPTLNVYVVGHTDLTGSYDYNLKLSEDRAKAVVEALVANYAIPRERLEPHGVGPLSPVFTNKADDGREKNRRVELVER